METKLSQRLAEIIKALPLGDGIRILEIGCGPGAAVREIVKHIGRGHILAIDRSPKAIKQALNGSKKEIASGRLSFRQVSVEDFELEKGEQAYDIALAIRVGVLDGRHPKTAELALTKIAKALTTEGKLFIDGGNPLKEISLDRYRNG